VHRFNAHPAHQRRHVPAADLLSFPLQLRGKLPGAVERPLQVQLVEPTHQHQIPIRYRTRFVVHARPAQIQQLRLVLHRHLSAPIDHRLPLRPGNFPSAPDKKSRSTVSSPIFSCSSRIRSRPSPFVAVPPKVSAKCSSAWVFQLVTWFAWTSWCAAISAIVFSPRIPSKATRALNAAEWFRLGFLMDFVPPVRSLPGSKSTYTRVRKTGATSGYKIVGVWKETASGAKDERAERKKVLALAQARKIDVIPVTELTRWGRSVLDLFRTLQDLQSWEVSLVAQTGLQFDLRGAQGKLIASVMAALAEFERDLLRERARSGIAA